MYCNNCGQKLPDNSKFCPVCGAQVVSQPQQNNLKGMDTQKNQSTHEIWNAQQNTNNQQGNYNQQSNYGQQSNYSQQGNFNQQGNYNQQNNFNQQGNSAPYQYNVFAQQNTTQQANVSTEEDMPMKWFKFLTRFALIAGAIINFLSGVLYITGMIWEAQGVDVYSAFPDIQSVDVVYGIAAAMLGVYALSVRSSLAKFKKKAPSMLTGFYIVNIATSLLYSIAITSITGVDVITDSITSVMITIFFLVYNIGYFGKRQHMFVN